jgi:hypothetical protein
MSGQSQSQSQSYFGTGGFLRISSAWRKAPWASRHSNFIFQQNSCSYSPYVTSCLTRGWVCRFQLLLDLVSEVILRSESRGTHDHILLSQIRDSPNLEEQVPAFLSLRKRDARIYPQVLGPLFVASYDSQGYGWDIRPRLQTGVALVLVWTAAYIVSGFHGKCWLFIRIRGNLFWFRWNGNLCWNFVYT